ncbi:ABC transporter ATP-binding protein [Desulfonatronospira sp. MSAO_Bac3]|uniref:ABC transporter ATP-binding protein n=1 Tax=Desulfonatronospira sp. MSAO_Bac3 TaxID=2293857 RepID=UPI000FF84D10|nr:ABC transporter ATP-binding protein [Desulfonatronospira sp. MSAO_Bac3]RQD77940.1 MAG: ABC transporter ATP-binding protein [Desulfonatronospira sp. MSAO_Bac3]
MAFSMKDVHFALGETSILEDINIDLPPGRIYGILGPNGSGKSTWLDLLIRHRVPQQGMVEYNGRPLGSYSRKQISKEMALVPQDYRLNFPFQVLEVLLMGRYPFLPRFASPGSRDLDIVREVMQKTGLEKFQDRMVTELSGGERQRVVFARALVQDTPVLILDEATASLDIKHGLHLLSLVRQKNQQARTTVFSVFQDINLAAAFCSHIIFFKQGRILLHGPTTEVLTPQNLERVFDVRAKVYFDDYAQSTQVVFKV